MSLREELPHDKSILSTLDIKMKKSRAISFVTISHGHFDYVSELVESMMQHWSSPFELIIVDNLNSDKFELLIQQHSKQLDIRRSSIRLYKHKKPRSFGVGNNFAIRKASNEHIFIINPDTRFVDSSIHDWFQEQEDKLEGRLIYPRLLNADGTGQQHYNEWPHLANQFVRLIKAKAGRSTAQRQRSKDWFFASAIITTKRTFSRLNGFEELFPLYCEDVDLCYKAKLLNIPCEHITYIKMIHHLGGEAKTQAPDQSYCIQCFMEICPG
ncbi:glycosyltransferase [Vibrio hannami]|uniref:glycosyltransferase family 2 protein n=1 Tax=Vibrio hannami TaxID=2717094 RepID=UPI0024102611|nr:glycosyltransferase [Vibrio hannami]MDG3088661.1 glycosyltransferase [Vibrio hannami]